MTAPITGTELALTLFSLKETSTVNDYRAFSRDVIRPGMFTMPAVVGFLDYQVEGGLTATDGWQLVELIAITSREQFEVDNSTIGADLAAQWEEWVQDYRVLFLSDLLPEVASAPNSTPEPSSTRNGR